MRTFGAVIKIVGFLFALSVANISGYFADLFLLFLSTIAMLLLFLCQAAEIFLGYRKEP